MLHIARLRCGERAQPPAATEASRRRLLKIRKAAGVECKRRISGRLLLKSDKRPYYAEEGALAEAAPLDALAHRQQTGREGAHALLELLNLRRLCPACRGGEREVSAR